MLDLRLYMAQRISALVMVPLVIVHIALMIYAVQGGLSSAEILGRTRGSWLWFIFYGTFVVAVAVHGAIGVRTVLHEWVRLSGFALTLTTLLIGFALVSLGAHAVWAVTFA